MRGDTESGYTEKARERRREHRENATRWRLVSKLVLGQDLMHDAPLTDKLSSRNDASRHERGVT